MGFFTSLWSNWGKSKSILPSKEKKAPVVKKLAKRKRKKLRKNNARCFCNTRQRQNFRI